MKKKRKMEADSTYVVVHKNPDSWHTKGGKVWAVDGLKSNWDYSRAELHVHRCEYADFGILYEVIPLADVGKYIPSLETDDEIQEL